MEDVSADYLEVKSLAGVVTIETARLSEAAGTMLKLVTLSEGTSADDAFARQVIRKYV